jgi:hypothetical protein
MTYGCRLHYQWLQVVGMFEEIEGRVGLSLTQLGCSGAAPESDSQLTNALVFRGDRSEASADAIFQAHYPSPNPDPDPDPKPSHIPSPDPDPDSKPSHIPHPNPTHLSGALRALHSPAGRGGCIQPYPYLFPYPYPYP